MIAVLVALSIVLLAGIVIVGYIGPRILLMPQRRGPDFYRKRYGFAHPSDLGLKFEDGSVTTEDGLRLSYWAIEPQDCDHRNGYVIYLHGITDSKSSGLNYAKELIEFCQKVFLLDMRSHGESDGKYCTYGYYEKRDVSKLIDKIRDDDPEAVISLLGVSMGAAIALQTAAADDRVSRVIAVAPFYDLFSIALDHQVKKIGIRSRILLRLVLHQAERMARFKADEVSPALDIGKIQVPVLIVHGEEDKTVKKEYSKILQGLNHGAQLLAIPGAGHIDVLEKGGKNYLEELEKFLRS